MKKIIIMITLITIYLTINTVTSQALTIKTETNRYNLINYEYTEKELNIHKMESVVNDVYKDLQKTYLKNVPVKILYAEKSIKKIKGCMFQDKQGTYIIIMAIDKNYKEIYTTFLHEVGHIVRDYYNIDLKIFSYLTNTKYYDNSNEWKARSEEYFAESFKCYYIKTYNNSMYNFYSIKTATNGRYKADFDIVIWLYVTIEQM